MRSTNTVFNPINSRGKEAIVQPRKTLTRQDQELNKTEFLSQTREHQGLVA